MFRFFAATLLLLSVLALPARADNLAIEWMDRVTHSVEEKGGPLSKRALDLQIRTGLYGYYTDNLFLEPNRVSSGDSALVGFAGGTLDYADTRWEAQVNALVNFDYYMETHAAREDEERLYGKIRYADGAVDLELVEVARRESDVVDAVFPRHVRRIVSDTLPRIGFVVAKGVRMELAGQAQVVRFEGSEWDAAENENYRARAVVRGEVSPRVDLVGEAGVLAIHYRRRESPPDARGVFVRGGVRGEVTETLLVEATAGWTWARSRDEEVGDDERERRDGADLSLHARWQAAETFTLHADWTRRFGWATGASSFQAVDRWLVLAEWQVVEPVTLHARAQYDRVDPTQAPRRTFASAGIGATWQIIENLAVDGGGLWQIGNQHGLNDDNWDEWIGYLGAVLRF